MTNHSFTWIEDACGGLDISAPQHSENLLPYEPYHSPNDVPVSLQHMLRRAYDSGLTVPQLATIYELPETWLELFCRPCEGES